jgi:hypothetical protein
MLTEITVELTAEPCSLAVDENSFLMMQMDIF